jgi:hypothetical protein
MNKDTIIIVLLIILIGLYIWDMYKREHFMGYGPVDYNTLKVNCDNLTGSRPCVVDTVKPSRDLVCNKRFEVVDPNTLRDKTNPRNIRKGIIEKGGMEMSNSNDMDLIIKDKRNKVNILEDDNALSFDELDKLSMDQMDMSEMNVQPMDMMMNKMAIFNDDVSYSTNNEKDNHNKNIKNKISNDMDTLSDVEKELISIN